MTGTVPRSTAASAPLSRRRFLHGAAAGALASALRPLAPGWARAHPGGGGIRGAGGAHASVIDGLDSIDLAIGQRRLGFGGRGGRAMTLNGSVPGPLVRLREGQRATLRVTNELDEDTSIHWHGILLPYQMDGVPGVGFPGIRPGETFTYQYDVVQSGTYWYHSHSGLQEQSGVYGPLVIDPRESEPHAFDREHVVLLSDWTFEAPHSVLQNLKVQSDYYDFQKRTLADLVRDIGEQGLRRTLSDRVAWGAMRMSPTDIADVTAATYTYLMNGLAPQSNWTGLFEPGERVRLRFINGSAMTYFNVRIPGLPLTIVQADGQDVRPVEVDEFQIGVAETYDAIVTPREDRAYTVFAESMDRSGYTRGTLAPRIGMEAAIPALRKRPLRTMADMGMDHGAAQGGMDHAQAAAATPSHPDHSGMDHSKMDHAQAARTPMKHASTMHHAAPTPAAARKSRLSEPGTGLADVPHRVLAYGDLQRLTHDFDPRPPGREIELHLTGNMERYMWSFDGLQFSQVDGPIEFEYGERLRLVLINDTMMEHPIHLHGMWMELENGHGRHIPRKHTVSVKPAERLTTLVNADARGRWAFHCHLLYHMHMGMFRVVRVA